MKFQINARSLNLRIVLISLLGLTIVSGCGGSQSHRQSARQENDANLQAEMEDLLPAEGTFTGKMVMIKSGKSYKISLVLKRILHTEDSPSTADPTQKISIPKLSGNLEFDVLGNLDPSVWDNYPEILRPLGGFGHLVVDNGDLDPATLQVILPYAVPGYANGNYGQLTGVLKNDKFTGTWFAKPLGVVGRFSLKKKNAQSVESTGGAQ